MRAVGVGSALVPMGIGCADWCACNLACSIRGRRYHTLLGEDGRMERADYLGKWKGAATSTSLWDQFCASLGSIPPPHTPWAMVYLVGIHAYPMLIGACMGCPIHAVRVRGCRACLQPLRGAGGVERRYSGPAAVQQHLPRRHAKGGRHRHMLLRHEVCTEATIFAIRWGLFRVMCNGCWAFCLLSGAFVSSTPRSMPWDIRCALAMLIGCRLVLASNGMSDPPLVKIEFDLALN